jgi:hypothetical protein
MTSIFKLHALGIFPAITREFGGGTRSARGEINPSQTRNSPSARRALLIISQAGQTLVHAKTQTVGAE